MFFGEAGTAVSALFISFDQSLQMHCGYCGAVKIHSSWLVFELNYSGLIVERGHTRNASQKRVDVNMNS